MIERRINGKKTNIPTNWGDIDFGQYVDIMEKGSDARADDYEIISIALKIPRETLMKADMENVLELLTLLNFLRHPAVPDLKPKRLLNFLLPKDIVLENLEQFEDMRQVMKQHTPSEDDTAIEKIVKITKAYPKYAAIYCQKLRDKEYDYDKALAMEKEFWNAPCLEVISAGSFFLINLNSSFSSTQKTSLQLVPVWKKSRLAFLKLQRFGDSILRWIKSAVRVSSRKMSS